MQKELNDIKQYAYQRICEMPLVKARESEEELNIFIDVSEVNEKYYNGVLIGNAARVAKILNEEYGVKVVVCEEPGKASSIKVSLENSSDTIKKTLNRMEAFVSSI